MTEDYYNTNPDGTKCTSWIQDPDTLKLIPRSRYREPQVDTYMVMKPIEPFVSQIDGRVISCRSTLRAHNREHGVTNTADYSHTFLKHRRESILSGQAIEDKKDRVNKIRQELHRYKPE